MSCASDFACGTAALSVVSSGNAEPRIDDRQSAASRYPGSAPLRLHPLPHKVHQVHSVHFRPSCFPAYPSFLLRRSPTRQPRATPYKGGTDQSVARGKGESATNETPMKHGGRRGGESLVHEKNRSECGGEKGGKNTTGLTGFTGLGLEWTTCLWFGTLIELSRRLSNASATRVTTS